LFHRLTEPERFVHGLSQIACGQLHPARPLAKSFDRNFIKHSPMTEKEKTKWFSLKWFRELIADIIAALFT
jgi:hypothetical protein